jgi:hypothetical protein
MNHVSEQLDWSYMSIMGAVLGFVLHLMMSWKEWVKVSKQPDLTFWCFYRNDPPTQITGIILVLFTYCSLSAMSQLEWIKALMGFSPKVDFFSAFMTAFASQGFGVKLANMLKKINGSD